MSQEILIELLVSSLEVMTVLNLVVNCCVIMLVIEHLESDGVA